MIYGRVSGKRGSGHKTMAGGWTGTNYVNRKVDFSENYEIRREIYTKKIEDGNRSTIWGSWPY